MTSFNQAVGESKVAPPHGKGSQKSPATAPAASPVNSLFVKELQQDLVNLGYDKVAPSGKFDVPTNDALINYVLSPTPEHKSSPLWKALYQRYRLGRIQADPVQTVKSLDEIVELFRQNGEVATPKEDPGFRDLPITFNGTYFKPAGNPIQVNLPLRLMARSAEDTDRTVKVFVLNKYYAANGIPAPQSLGGFPPEHLVWALSEISEKVKEGIEQKESQGDDLALHVVNERLMAFFGELIQSYSNKKDGKTDKDAPQNALAQVHLQHKDLYDRVGNNEAVKQEMDNQVLRSLLDPGVGAINADGVIIRPQVFQAAWSSIRTILIGVLASTYGKGVYQDVKVLPGQPPQNGQPQRAPAQQPVAQSFPSNQAPNPSPV